MSNIDKKRSLKEEYFLSARKNMVERHLIPDGITHPDLLEAFSTLPREAFIPDSLKHLSYSPSPIKITEERHLLPPTFLGRLIQETLECPIKKTLVIGGSTGYSAALLSLLSHKVTLLESEATHISKAQETFEHLNLNNITPIKGALQKGFPKDGPFNLILIEGTSSHIPNHLFEQLTCGGFLITFRSDGNQPARATCVKREQKALKERIRFEATVPLLPDFDHQPLFVF